MRQELVQRRIEQANGHRQSGHDLEQRFEVRALHGQHLGKRLAAAGFVVGADHLAHGENAAFLEEHMLGAAEPDALGTELPRLAGLARGIGVGAHAERSRLVGPPHDGGKVAGQLGLAHLHTALEHLALAAVDGDDVALPEDLTGDCHGAGLIVDTHRAGTAHARPPHAARHYGGMTRHAAPGGEDAGGRMHAVDVLGARFDADQDDLPALTLQGLGLVRIKHDLA